jgi:hypothetical protein
MKLAAVFALLLVAGAGDVGQSPTYPDLRASQWMRTARSPDGISCADGAEGYREGAPVKMANGEPTVIFRSWWVASDGYHLDLTDPADHHPVHVIWYGPIVRPNLSDGAVVWLSRENGFVLVRCFSPPGPQG